MRKIVLLPNNIYKWNYHSIEKETITQTLILENGN